MIVGITGPIGAGKGAVSRMLSEEGFEHLTISDSLKEELERKNMALTRLNYQNVADDLRKQYGPGVLARFLLKKVLRGKMYVVDGFRNPGEVEEFRNYGDFVLVLVDSSLYNRSKRVFARRKSGDAENLEDFRKMDEKDRGIGQESHGQQSGKCWEMADHTVVNDESFEDLKKEVLLLLGKIKC